MSKRVFRLDYLPDVEFTMGFELLSGMTVPEQGEAVLAVLPTRQVELKIISQPSVTMLNNSSIICTFRVLQVDTA